MLDEFEKQVGFAANSLLQAINAADWLERDVEPVEQVLENTFDKGDKVCVIGGSKTKKSFFLLQMSLSLASGADFLKWKVRKPHKVLHIQLEIQPHHFHRRCKKMANALAIDSADIGTRLQIVNGRGLGIVGEEGIRKILELSKTSNPDVIVIDPLYKILDGVENAIEGLKPLLDNLDTMARETGAAIVYCHHDPKGSAGDRSLSDRGAGSGVLARDYDASIILTPHANEGNGIVVETLLRNYRPQESFTILWDDREQTGGYGFVVAKGIVPVKLTSKNAKQTQPEIEAFLPAALEILKSKPLPVGEFTDRFKQLTSLTDKRIASFKSWAINAGHIVATERRGKGIHEKILRIPDDIDGTGATPAQSGAPLA